jgi:hypothetical protein
MGQILKYPTLDAPEDCEKEEVFSGTSRQFWSWVFRLMASNKRHDFGYRKLTATTTETHTNIPHPPDPPTHHEVPINKATGEIGQLLDCPLPENAVVTVVLRTPSGPPPKATRDCLVGQGFHWNPDDARGDKNYPQRAWLKHRVAAPDLPTYRTFAAKLKLAFDYHPK